MSKPNVLIIGGCGFIGRNLVQYLVESDVCNHIKVIDKTTPTVAFLSKQHADLFKHPKVKFKQGNAKSIGIVFKSHTHINLFTIEMVIWCCFHIIPIKKTIFVYISTDTSNNLPPHLYRIT